MPDCPDDEDTGTAPYLGRTSLRPYSVSDAAAVIEALQDRNLVRWLAALPVPVDQHACEKYLRFLSDPDVCARVVCVDAKLVGVVSLGTELSFWLRREYHRKGVGSWALRCFLDQLPIGTSIVNACCMQENESAAATLVKLGFDRVDPPFRRFSFAHGHAVEFLRFRLCRRPRDQGAGN